MNRNLTTSQSPVEATAIGTRLGRALDWGIPAIGSGKTYELATESR